MRFSPYAPLGDYKVVSTDYENYSIVYSCTDVLVGKFDLFWVLTRDQDLKPEVEAIVTKVFAEKLPTVNVKANLFRTAQGGKCQYLQ